MLMLEERDEALRWDGLSQCLINLRLREFWTKRRGVSGPVKLRTLDVPDPLFTPQLREQIRKLRDASGTRYGRLKEAICRDLAANRYDVPQPPAGGASTHSDHDTGANDIPLWGN
jgi:hypothetical protein